MVSRSVLLFFSSISFLPCLAYPPPSNAQCQQCATIAGTVRDRTGAVVGFAELSLTSSEGHEAERHATANSVGEFSFSVASGTYVLRANAPGFAPYTSHKIGAKSPTAAYLSIQLELANVQQKIEIEDGDNGDAAVGNGEQLVLEGNALGMLSADASTLKQQLMALAGGPGTVFRIDGLAGGLIPPKSSIRSIRISQNLFSAYYAEPGFHVDISTKPGGNSYHGALSFSGTDQPLDARDPYTPQLLPFYDFQEDGNLNGPLGKKTSFFVSEHIESLSNNVAVNAADPANPSSTLSFGLPAPQRIQTYSLRLDHQFSEGNFAHVRDEWSQTRVINSDILPLVLPNAAATLNTLTNTLQLSDTQAIGPHAVNEVKFQYIRTRVRRDPNSTLPSILVEGAFQDGGSPSQELHDNQDAYLFEDRLEFDHGKHSFRTGLQFRSLRDANQSTGGFNGQYIFPDVASYLALQPEQYSQTVGQQSAVLMTTDIGFYGEDDWKLMPTFTLSYGGRLETQSAIPNRLNPAPRIGFAWSVRPGKRKTPLFTLRGGYGIFYDRFPALQLLQAVRQNGVREVTRIAQNPTYNPQGAPPALVLTDAQPTSYRVDPNLKTSYGQMASLRIGRSFGHFGNLSGTLQYTHNAHNYLTENINAPLPGTFDPAHPSSALRPLGTDANIYQFSSAANGNTERFFINYNLQLSKQLTVFGVFDTAKDRNETDGITSFPTNQYNLQQDYGRTATDRSAAYTGGFTWALPHGFSLTPFLFAHTGLPFDITTGTDSNGDTIYNDRPAFAAAGSRPSVVETAFGAFDVAPATGTAVIPRNLGTAPGFLWLQVQAAKDFHIGPRPQAAAAGAGDAPSPRPDRPWDLSFNVEVHNITNHNNPGIPVGVISAQPCGAANTAGCTCPVMVGQCALAPSQYFGHSLSLASDFSPITASNRTILLQTNFTF